MTGTKGYTTIQSNLICPCGAITPIQRRVRRQKKVGYIKHMYCYNCKEVTAHKEVKEYGMPL